LPPAGSSISGFSIFEGSQTRELQLAHPLLFAFDVYEVEVSAEIDQARVLGDLLLP
jgi:hypothetical protein